MNNTNSLLMQFHITTNCYSFIFNNPDCFILSIITFQNFIKPKVSQTEY